MRLEIRVLYPHHSVFIMGISNKLLSSVVDGGFLFGFSIEKAEVSSLNISYLLFADDTNSLWAKHDHI